MSQIKAQGAIALIGGVDLGHQRAQIAVIVDNLKLMELIHKLDAGMLTVNGDEMFAQLPKLRQGRHMAIDVGLGLAFRGNNAPDYQLFIRARTRSRGWCLRNPDRMAIGDHAAGDRIFGYFI